MAIHHVVFIKFKKDAGRESIGEFIEELNKIPEMNCEISGWISGFSPEPRFHNGDFDLGMAGDLPDEAAMERYMFHESHLRMGPYAAAVVEYMLSFDFRTDYAQPDRFPERPLVEPERESDPGTGRTRVPSVVGHKLEEAGRILEEAGLRGGATQSVVGSVWAVGRVIQQQPAAGTIAEPGTNVDLGVTSEYWMRPAAP